jgi:transposase
MKFEVIPHHSALGATDMAIVPVYVGLDYHTDSIRVCILNEEGKELLNRSFPNVVEVVAEKILEHGQPVGCAIEACCGAADFADELQRTYQLPVRLAHPGYVRRLKQGPDKTDCGDAFLLADLIRVDYLPEVWLAPEATRQLRRLVRYRQQLRDSKTELKQQLRAILREERVQGAPANAWTKQWLAWLGTTTELSAESHWIVERQLQRLTQLTEELRELDARLAKMTAQDQVTQRLQQQSGIGLITAVVLRAQIGDFRRFGTGKQLSRFCGLTPCNASSGKRQADAGLVRAGNRELRRVLLEAAHRLVRHDERWKKLYGQLVYKQRKPAPVAIAAVANRWVRWLRHQIADSSLQVQAA